MMQSEPIRILVSNDDGFMAPGIIALADALSQVGEVWVVAPDREQSGSGHSLSLHRPLRMKEVGIRTFCVDGTPTDCIYLALSHLLKDKKVHLVASGINSGANLGGDLTYSGTVAAAMEGCVFGVPSFAISLAKAQEAEGDYSSASAFAQLTARALLEGNLPKGTFLNINVPQNVPETLPWKASILGKKEYERLSECRTDPRGAKYFWIGGPYLGADDIPGSDCNVVAAGTISVTPVQTDLTAFNLLKSIQALSLG